MLELIRAHAQSWGVKIAFGIIILVFVFWGVGSMHNSSSGALATVNKKPILIQEFGREYERQVETLRSRYPGITAEDMKQMGLKRQVLQAMITERLLADEAARIGLSVSPVELRRSIESITAFRNGDGRFDAEVYRSVLKGQQTSPGRFEDGIRRDMLLQKLRDRVAAPASVTDEEARALFDYGRERRTIEYVLFPLEDYVLKVAPTDEQIAERYNENMDAWRNPQRISLDAVTLTPASLATSVEIPESAVAAFYADNAETYFVVPERVHARHILFMAQEGASKDEDAAARAKAEDVIAQLKKGKDFASLAAKLSDDKGSGAQGGDLGWFTKGQMVPPFEEAAFALKPGEISAPVRSAFGWHVIKMEAHETQRTRALDEVRGEIRQRLGEEKASERMHEALDTALEMAGAGKSIDDIAKALKLEHKPTGLFSRADAGVAVGLKGQSVGTAFSTPAGTVIDTPLEVEGGYMIAAVLESQPESVTPLEKVKEEVAAQVRRIEGAKLAVKAAQEAGAKLADGVPAELAARVKTAEPFGRNGFIAPFGQSRALVDAAFAAAPGAWQPAPVDTSSGAVLFRVKDVQRPGDAEWSAAAETVRATVLSAKREELFRVFVGELSAAAKIELRNAKLLDD
ncbi:peptidylprolyl isomerase [Nitratidesulfovibrio sp. SRB-5]|uniref:peptidylprolyl isomerase n=1 Tax=Nitratidesulfovibrio sp. SRB-5 TaxID=2872636 RepID=UPI0010255949|nr:peptidylprolyl isomerase [Nitratidesulfovibrio sp. SRB-5]MBZ2171197.1 SurA N-terminal domain-containing protein [Nitratidesulfovibrio sp. SRB-5]RXF75816.1 peptidylprolyl isomerase [Desulfovibrio sp. DS-1]